MTHFKCDEASILAESLWFADIVNILQTKSIDKSNAKNIFEVMGGEEKRKTVIRVVKLAVRF